jgi:hypothetical protein
VDHRPFGISRSFLPNGRRCPPPGAEGPGQPRAAVPRATGRRRSFLSAIVQAMISFTAVVLSITIVVLQLSSSQFSPRVLRHFMQDRVIQSSLGVFVAT